MLLERTKEESTKLSDTEMMSSCIETAIERLQRAKNSNDQTEILTCFADVLELTKMYFITGNAKPNACLEKAHELYKEFGTFGCKHEGEK